MNPLTLVQPHLDAGRLVELLPDRPLDIPLYWQVARLPLPELVRLSECGAVGGAFGGVIFGWFFGSTQLNTHSPAPRPVGEGAFNSHICGVAPTALATTLPAWVDSRPTPAVVATGKGWYANAGGYARQWLRAYISSFTTTAGTGRGIPNH